MDIVVSHPNDLAPNVFGLGDISVQGPLVSHGGNANSLLSLVPFSAFLRELRPFLREYGGLFQRTIQQLL